MTAEQIKLVALVSIAYSLHRIATIYEFQKAEMLRMRDQQQAQMSGRVWI